MNCVECQAVLGDYLEGRLQGELRHEVARHLAACETCRLEAEADSHLEALLSGAPLKEPPADFAARVLDRTRPLRRPINAGVLAAVGYLASGAALAAGVYRSLTWVPTGFASPEGVTSGLAAAVPRAGGEAIGVVVLGVRASGSEVSTAIGRWFAALPSAPDLAAVPGQAVLYGGAVAGLALLSGVLFLSLRGARAHG